MKRILGTDIRQNMSKYFGKKVMVTGFYHRAHRHGQKVNRKWVRMGTAEKEGLLIGLRSLRNGNVQWFTDHSEWYPEGDPVPAFLVVFNSHLKPVLVPIDDVTYIPNGGSGIIDHVISLVRTERINQNHKWGVQNHDNYRWLAILSEEVGEVSQAILHDEFGGKAAGTVKAELIQTAAVAFQWIECLVRNEGKE